MPNDNTDQTTLEGQQSDNTSTPENENNKNDAEVTFTEEQQAKIDELLKQRTAKYVQDKAEFETEKKKAIEDAIKQYQAEKNMTAEQLAEEKQKKLAEEIAKLKRDKERCEKIRLCSL